MESCPRCGRPVIFAALGESQTLTLDAEPSPAGTVAILDGRAHYLSGASLRYARESNFTRYTRHYVKSCPTFYPKHPMRWTEKEFRDAAAKREAKP